MTIPPRLAAFVVLTLVAVGAAGLQACATAPATEREIPRPWLVTVYYTVVESFHHDAPLDVVGCPSLDCADGNEPLGRYPVSFVAAVRDEGTGRITRGPHAGRYLNWSHDVGFWLDSAPRDAHGRPLEPFRSAAADSLPDGTRLRLVDCGRLAEGDPVPDDICRTLRAGDWEIRDRFSPDLGGEQHIDLYIGEETEPEFSSSGSLYVTLYDASFASRG